MKKARNIMLIALVALTITSLYSVAGTYAKYTSTKEASDTARVAKWNINVTGGNFNETNKTFDLFKNVYELDNNGNVTATAEDHMVNKSDPADGKNLVAPGTGGFVEITVANAGEVDAKFEGKLTEIINAENIPLEFSGWNEAGTWVTVNGTAQDADLNRTLISKELKPGETATFKIYWRWLYENAPHSTTTGGDTIDAKDTTLGEATTPATVKVTAKLTATQVD